MGNKSSISVRGYHPAIYAMHRSMELKEQLAQEREIRMEKIAENKQLRKSYWYGRQANAMASLKSIDPDGWEAWYDSDAVPEYGTEKSRALLVEERICTLLAGSMYRRATCRLYHGTFIWKDESGAFLFSKDNRLVEFLGELEAQAWVDDASNPKYGGARAAESSDVITSTL